MGAERPVSRPPRGPAPEDSDARRALESAKEAKYAEIRDNETDYRTGKLSDEDFRALDRQLRAEAVEILRAIDRARRPGSGARPIRLYGMQALFSTLQVVICVILVLLILMHSGKDSGLSGAFGVGTGTGPLGGGSLVERNLNRWTDPLRDPVRREHDPAAETPLGRLRLIRR